MQRFEKFAVFLLLLMVATPAAIGILLLLRAAGPLLWSQEAAGWVQAVGSIAAIWFAVKSVRDADRLNARRRYDSILALAESTERFCRTVSSVFRDGGFGYLELRTQYRAAFINSLIDALKAVSAQDLGSYNAILAFTMLKEAVDNLKGNVERASADLAALRNPNTGAIPSWHTWNATALELCMQEITRSVKGLRDHRPEFAK